eukprot:TRINITY_DN1639_c0_g6_i1.p1 TRINITY_DN1639_c0_g6~~TRINITY_DN1639_c0_g6_i1.p1  ORF type:complete len:188 (-),score=52.26 TRINITY_DN1639_c0_g6_i1:310-873(-)
MLSPGGSTDGHFELDSHLSSSHASLSSFSTSSNDDRSSRQGGASSSQGGGPGGSGPDREKSSDRGDIEDFVLNQVPWEQLPIALKKELGNSQDQWKEFVVRYSIRHQLKWKFVKEFVQNERQYYLELIRVSRISLMVRLFDAAKLIFIQLPRLIFPSHSYTHIICLMSWKKFTELLRSNIISRCFKS